MSVEEGIPPRGPNGTPEFEELQRSQEDPPTVEILERAAPTQHPEQMTRTVPVPDPGERPRAIRPGEETTGAP